MYRYFYPIYLKDGMHLANGFERIVHGGRGDYIEISPNFICRENLYIPDGQKWRLTSGVAYYVEHRSCSTDNVKVYEQKRPVKYADYKVGMFYIAPEFLRDFKVAPPPE